MDPDRDAFDLVFPPTPCTTSQAWTQHWSGIRALVAPGGQAWALALRAGLAAAAGPASRRDLQAAMGMAASTGLGNQLLFVNTAVEFLELGLEHTDQAITALERVERLADEQGLEEPTLVP